MHYLVNVIVKAKDATEANAETDSLMMNLVECKEFDWYSGEDDDSRWEDCWKPMQLSNEKAQAIVQVTMQSQFAEFKEALSAIRLMLTDYTDEQIFNEQFEPVEGRYLSRYQFDRASGYHGGVCQLFNDGGEPIISQQELDWYLKDPKDFWLVRVGCHN